MKSDKNLVIVGGGGHVGLPLGLVLAERGMQVKLLDLDPKRVAHINSGKMPFMEEGADELLGRLIHKSLVATSDSECLEHADVVITVVGTPVDRHLKCTGSWTT
jgi:UDP-N-acetyl-D-mannosaminuronic acid dehydrogenase